MTQALIQAERYGTPLAQALRVLAQECRDQRMNEAEKKAAALPPKLRFAILLRYVDDLSYADMAAALNCSMGTVASRLSRGHRLLASRLSALRAAADGR